MAKLFWNRWTKAVLIAVLVLGGAVGISIFWLSSTVLSRGRQIRNLEEMRTYRHAIEAYLEAEGTLPPSLEEAVRAHLDVERYPHYLEGKDLYGHPVIYLPYGDRYYLLSLGRDGRPDGTDYAAYRRDDVYENESCEAPDADLIFSDRGEHRSCGK